MARSDLKMLSLDELERFVKRVEKMRAEGATTTEIAAAFGIPRSTLYMRLRRWKIHRSVAQW